MIVNAPFEITLSVLPDAESRGSIRIYLTGPGAHGSGREAEQVGGKDRPAIAGPTSTEAFAGDRQTWIFQASPRFSEVKGALRSVEAPVCLVRQFSKEIKPGDRVYLWECGPGGGIIGVAEVSEAPRIQAEPPEQLPFIRESEKFAGNRLRVKLQVLKRISPVISRKYLLSRPELTGLTILRCPRGTNFQVSREQAAVLQRVVEQFTSFFPNGKGSGEKRIVFAEG